MSRIVAVKTSFPEQSYDQVDIQNTLEKSWPQRAKHIRQFGESSSVKARNLALPPEITTNLGDIGERSRIWTEEALKLQTRNIVALQEMTGIDLKEITMIVSTTVTGLTIPTLEAKLMNILPFSPNVKRVPLFGIGCLGGVAGLNRVKDYLDGHPKEAALLLATELCSLTFQMHDQSVANLVGTALFGDGSAAVLMVGREHRLAKKAVFEIIDESSFFYPDTERMMGWDIISSGFQIVLSGDVPGLVREYVAKNLGEFLYKNHLSKDDLKFFVSHPGGPKVLEAISDVTQAKPGAFKMSWDSLREKGNMSSVSVLHVMEKTIQETNHPQGSLGLMLAMGPAFCSEMNLIRKL